jgi:hypothetical protein
MATTYTYDPSGTPTASGAANEWPFQFQGMEKEFTDPALYYYAGSGQFYSPQMVRSLSEAGEISSSQGACPSGNAIGAPSDSSGSGLNFPSSGFAQPENSSEGQTGRTTITVTGAAGAGATIGAIIGAAVGAPLAGSVIGAAVGAIVGDIASVFDDLFGGGGAPPTPRQLLHGRHPLYWKILAVPVVDETSSGTPEFRRSPSGEEYSRCPPSVSFPVCVGNFLAASLPTAVGCGVFLCGCNPADLPSCGLAVGTCAAEIGGIMGCYSQAHCGEFGNPGEELPPGELMPEPPLVKPGTEGAVP